MESELFILYSEQVQLITRVYQSEGEARHEAEAIARNNRGMVIAVARIVDTVSEPLPDLKWNSGASAGSGIRSGLRGVGSNQCGEEAVNAGPPSYGYKTERRLS